MGQIPQDLGQIPDAKITVEVNSNDFCLGACGYWMLS